jgi:ribosomal-protein-alanine N-acetyltransferase
MLRPGRLEDVEAMYRLDCLCFEEPFRFERETIEWLAAQPDAIVVVAESDGAMRGFAIVEVSRRREIACGYVATIDVDPEQRRSGSGRVLMSEIERQAKAKGLDQMSLHVFTGNDAAIAFYESAGYARIARVRDFYASEFDAFTYIKQL